MKSEAKKRVANFKSHCKGTGGGPPIKELDEIDQLVVAIAGKEGIYGVSGTAGLDTSLPAHNYESESESETDSSTTSGSSDSDTDEEFRQINFRLPTNLEADEAGSTSGIITSVIKEVPDKNVSSSSSTSSKSNEPCSSCKKTMQEIMQM